MRTAALLLAWIGLQSVSAMSCIGDDGNAVDYWVAFKFPAGYSYVYYGSNTKTLTTSPYAMDGTTKGALANTMNQVWSSGTSYVIYNDQIPAALTESERRAEGVEMNEEPMTVENIESMVRNLRLERSLSSSSYAHMKGVVSLNTGNGGFWLIHSVPLFPSTPSTSSAYQGLPSTSETYGQSFLCISLPTSSTAFNTIGSQLQIDRPQIYNSFMSSADQKSYPALQSALSGTHTTSGVLQMQTITSSAGVAFDIFAKSANWGKDLWNGGVGVQYQSATSVESWIRGYEEGPFCPPTYAYITLDVEKVKWGSLTFSETSDHSKWGITTSNNQQRACIGDINRMTSQYTRGGGCACVADSVLWNLMKTSIQTTDAC